MQPFKYSLTAIFAANAGKGDLERGRGDTKEAGYFSQTDAINFYFAYYLE